MRNVLILFVHLIVTVVRVMRPGGARSVIAEFCLSMEIMLSWPVAASDCRLNINSHRTGSRR